MSTRLCIHRDYTRLRTHRDYRPYEGQEQIIAAEAAAAAEMKLVRENEARQAAEKAAKIAAAAAATAELATALGVEPWLAAELYRHGFRTAGDVRTLQAEAVEYGGLVEPTPAAALDAWLSAQE